LKVRPLGIGHAGQIKPANEGGDLLPVAVGQRDHGIDGDFLGIHGFSHAVSSPSRLSVGVSD
jgi:hypothetical protein